MLMKSVHFGRNIFYYAPTPHPPENDSPHGGILLLLCVYVCMSEFR